MVRTSAASSCTSTETAPTRKLVGKRRSNAQRDPGSDGDRHQQRRKPAAPRAPRRASLQGKRVGLLINTKRNARPFLEEVGRLLHERYDVTLTKRTKINFAVPEPEDVIKELAPKSDVIITGVGDCGSCSAAAAADGVVLEAAGVPVAVIVTDSFRATADAMAALRGAPGYKYAITAHPVAVLDRGPGQGARRAGARRRGGPADEQGNADE